MLGALGHIGGLVAYLATARRQHASDEATARQLAWTGACRPAIELTWLAIRAAGPMVGSAHE